MARGIPSLLLLLLCFSPRLHAATETCERFKWATDSDGAEKAAILVPVSIDSQTIDLQLDTGSDVTAIFGENRRSGPNPAKRHLEIGTVSLGSQPLVSMPDIPVGAAGGILGLSALLDQVVILDYRLQLLCFAGPQVATKVEEEYLFVPARLQFGKLFIFSGINDDHHWGYFLDTGASIYDLVVDYSEWQALTGKTGREPENSIIHGFSWSQPITTVGAQLNGHLALGALKLDRPVVHFIRQRASRFANYPFLARGLIGNAPFFEQKILLDLRTGKIRFGIAKKTLSEGSGQLSYPYLERTDNLSR